MAGNPIAGVNEGGVNKNKVKELMGIFDITYTSPQLERQRKLCEIQL